MGLLSKRVFWSCVSTCRQIATFIEQMTLLLSQASRSKDPRKAKVLLMGNAAIFKESENHLFGKKISITDNSKKQLKWKFLSVVVAKHCLWKKDLLPGQKGGWWCYYTAKLNNRDLHNILDFKTTQGISARNSITQVQHQMVNTLRRDIFAWIFFRKSLF